MLGAMRVLLLTSDLAVSSKVAGAAVRQQAVLVVAADVENAGASDPEESYNLAIVDLGIPRLDVRQIVERLKAQPQPPRSILAFGPHVHEGLLQAARDAGCDRVLSRGQFYTQLDEILKAHPNSPLPLKGEVGRGVKASEPIDPPLAPP